MKKQTLTTKFGYGVYCHYNLTYLWIRVPVALPLIHFNLFIKKILQRIFLDMEKKFYFLTRQSKTSCIITMDTLIYTTIYITLC
jgi:hypothetical protein